MLLPLRLAQPSARALSISSGPTPPAVQEDLMRGHRTGPHEVLVECVTILRPAKAKGPHAQAFETLNRT